MLLLEIVTVYLKKLQISRYDCHFGLLGHRSKAKLDNYDFVGPTGVYLLDFFCSGIQFNLLLSPYPCFISLLYLDLYVLGDDALIS